KVAYWPEDGQDENALPFLMCVMRGKADFHIGNYLLRCQAGDAVFVPAGVPKPSIGQSHFDGDVSNRECDILWITGTPLQKSLRCWICRSIENTHLRSLELGDCTIPKSFLAK